jgi:hypothetical protein
MDLLATLMGAAGGGTTAEIARKFGLNPDQVEGVMAKLVPALSAGVQKSAGSADGLSALAGALSSGKHEQYLDNPASLTGADAVADGNGILGHLLGSKDVSRQVAATAASSTGVDADIVKKMLPMIASLVMGGLSKQTGGGQRLQDDSAGDLLGGLLGGGDGVGLGDLAGMASKFLR